MTMRPTIQRLLFIVLMLGCSAVPAASTQTDTIIGTVTSAATGESLPGDKVAIKGTTQGTVQSPQEAEPSREEVLRGLRRAVAFYREQVSTRGGYHYTYTEDLSFGRSEHAEGPTQVSVQGGGTTGVGMVYLAAYEATGDLFYLNAVRETAHALVEGQLCSGGWDYLIEFDPASRRHYRYRTDSCDRPVPDDTAPDEDEEETDMRSARRSGPNTTTLDDNVTQGALRLLMRVDRELDFKNAKIHEAARYALEQLMKAQYPVGAWPQRYDHSFRPVPVKYPVLKASYPESWSREWPGPDFKQLYTFNDDTLADLIDMFLEAARIYDDERYREAAKRGGDFILRAQMPEPQPGWAQQYDYQMHPAWARRFEPPSITGGEAEGVMKILLVLYRETGDPKYLEPLPRALQYYRSSALPKVEQPSKLRSEHCPPGTEYCLARFYELRTNRPLYITNGSRVSIGTGFSSLLGGYELTYSDTSVITHYSLLTQGNDLDRIARRYELLSEADPDTIQRPKKLRGLSPWSHALRAGGSASPERSPEKLASKVAAILEAMDERGAWTEEGSIGTPDQLVSVYAGQDMVVKLGERTFPMKEDETLQIFRGTEPPKQRIISSNTFAENVETLSAYLRMLSENS